MEFEYYEIRPCVEFDDHTESYLGEPVFHPHIGGMIHTPENALKEAEEARDNRSHETPSDVFWTIYGRHTWEGTNVATAIGNFTTFEAAYGVMQAILLPMRKAATLIESETGPGTLETLNEAHSLLDDICNQSSTEERL